MTTTLTVRDDDVIDAIYTDKEVERYEPVTRRDLSRDAINNYSRRETKHVRTITTHDVYENDFSTAKDVDYFGNTLKTINLTLGLVMLGCFLLMLIGS